MQVSSVTANSPRLAIQRAGLSMGSGGFADLIASAGKGEVAAAPKPVIVPTATTPNFSKMTETEFSDQAKAMFDKGEIDFDTLSVMQINAHMAAAEVPDEQPIDFTAKFKSLMDFETNSGHRSSLLSGYKIYENILSKITPRTGANLIG